MIIKVCGMRDALNIRQVEALGVDWMGFIFCPNSPRYVSEIPAYMPVRAKRVGVFMDAPKDFISEQSELYGLDYIQLHGHESPYQCISLKALTGKGLIKAFGISAPQDFERTADYEEAADYFLFDSRNRHGGGSGMAFNHQLLSYYQGKRPFLLSGGLSPENAVEILSLKHPMLTGFDLNSRFETEVALKSVTLLRHFISIYNSKIKTTY